MDSRKYFLSILVVWCVGACDSASAVGDEAQGETTERGGVMTLITTAPGAGSRDQGTETTAGEPSIPVLSSGGLASLSGGTSSGSVHAQGGGQTGDGAAGHMSLRDDERRLEDNGSDRNIIVSGTPETTPAVFDKPENLDCAQIDIAYPNDGTVFPINIRGVSVQWRTSLPGPFRVRLTTGRFTVAWYTTHRTLELDDQAWEDVKSSALRAEPIEIDISASTDSDENVCVSAPLTIEVDGSPLKGAVYYWSTSDSGIMRLAAGDTAPEPFLNPQTAPQINCPACHALSRDGRKIAFTRTTFPPMGNLAISSTMAPTDLFFEPGAYPEGVIGFFPSFAPDAERIVASSDGQLIIRNVDDAVELDRLPLPPMRVAMSPDWSWQGDRIVAAMGEPIPFAIPNPLINLNDTGMTQGRIAQWHGVDDGWSMPEILVEPDADWSADRPSYSPNGQYIAYNWVGPDSNQDTDGNLNSEIWVVLPDGGPPVRLDQANGPMLSGNSWAKWAPNPGRNGRMWLAFSSLRSYGTAIDNAQSDSPTPQIWVTAIDPNAPQGTDPSAPAFWLPYQNPTSGNHIPYWAVYEKN